MSGGNFRGRGFGSRSPRYNRSTGAFHGPRFPHSNFKQSCLHPDRSYGTDNWLERPNHARPFPPWSTNPNFQRYQLLHGSSQFSFDTRERAMGHHTTLHFSNMGRAPVPSFHFGTNKSFVTPQTTPLLGSEEERQRKISETADRLKQTLSSITEEDITNLWENDYSSTSLSATAGKNVSNIVVPELRHEPPELNLTFNDFKDIGRVDSDNLKADNLDDIQVVQNINNSTNNSVNKANDIIDKDLNLLKDKAIDLPDSISKILQASGKTSGRLNMQETNERNAYTYNLQKSRSTLSIEVNDVSSIKANTLEKDKIRLIDLSQEDNNFKVNSTRNHNFQWLDDSREETCRVKVNVNVPTPSRYNSMQLQMSDENNESRSKENKADKGKKSQRVVCSNREFDITFHKNHTSSSRRDINSHRKGLPKLSIHSKCIKLRQDCPRNKSNLTSTELRSRLPSKLYKKANSINRDLESKSSQDILQPNPTSDKRNSLQLFTNISQNQEVLQPSPAFDPRGPPPTITTIELNNGELKSVQDFNIKQSTSNQERSNLNSRASGTSTNLINQSQHTNIGKISISTNLSISPRINVKINSSSTINSVLDEIPLPATSSSVGTVTKLRSRLQNVTLNDSEKVNRRSAKIMENGLEDMQEAMAFAKQVMHMIDETNNSTEYDTVAFSESSVTLSATSTESDNNINISLSSKRSKMDTPNDLKTNKTKKIHSSNTRKIQTTFAHLKIPDYTPTQNCNTEKNIPSVNEEIRFKITSNSKMKRISKEEERYQNRSTNETRYKRTKTADLTPMRENNEIGKMQVKEHIDKKKNITNKRVNQKKEICTNKNNDVKITEVNTSMDELPKQNNEKSSSQTVKTSHNSDIKKVQHTTKKNKKIEAPISESSWKSRVINRFLRMSKNDICNMINSSSLRKFDIAMKHLVKQQKSSLSLELRNTEDEKIKNYDREEFMNQLNAMLDPSAVVDITNLPTKFIHHLSEVLQLDPTLSDLTDPIVISDTESNYIKDTHDGNNSVLCNFINVNNVGDLEDCNDTEIQSIKMPSGMKANVFNSDISSPINSIIINDEIEAVSTSPIYEVTKSNDVRINYSSNEIRLEKDTLRKDDERSSFDVIDLDNIFSTVIEKTNNTPKDAQLEERKNSVSVINEIYNIKTIDLGISVHGESNLNTVDWKNVDDVFFVENTEGESTSFEIKDSEYIDSYKSTSNEDNSLLEANKCGRWYRKDREDPDAFRNLTKEEWDAKYGKSVDKLHIASTNHFNSNDGSSSRDTSKNVHPQLLLTSVDLPVQSSNVRPIKHETIINESNRISEGYSCSEDSYNRDEESNNDTDTDSIDSTTTTTTITSDSSVETKSDVTKLLKVIKENEKIGKKQSLNETIRDEVTAEIERRWREQSKRKDRKSRKKSRRKRERKEKHRKERKRKKKKFHDQSCTRDNAMADQVKIPMESKIKKEVIVKQELDLSVEQNECNYDLTNAMELNKRNVQADVTSANASLQTPSLTTDNFIKKNGSNALSALIQPKTKAQLKQMPDMGGSVEEKEFMKNTATIVSASKNSSNVKDKEKSDKQKMRSEQNREKTIITPESNKTMWSRDGGSTITVKEKSTVQNVVDNNNDKRLIVSKAKERFKEKSSAKNNTVVSLNDETIMKNKTPPKKIDIKAYKERALQRKLQEEKRLKERGENSAASTRQNSLKTSTMNKMQMTKDKTTRVIDTDADKREMKNSYQLCFKKVQQERVTSVSAVSDEINKSENTITDADRIQQDSTRPSIAEQSIETAGVNTKLPHQIKENKQDSNKLTAEIHNSIDTNEKSTSILRQKETVTDSNKFKNIRSEGSKELKLKKENAKKLNEAKKRAPKTLEIETGTSRSVNREIALNDLIVATKTDVIAVNEIEADTLCQSIEELKNIPEKIEVGASSITTVPQEKITNDFEVLQNNRELLAKDSSTDIQLKSPSTIQKTFNEEPQNINKILLDNKLQEDSKSTDYANIPDMNKNTSLTPAKIYFGKETRKINYERTKDKNRKNIDNKSNRTRDTSINNTNNNNNSNIKKLKPLEIVDKTIESENIERESINNEILASSENKHNSTQIHKKDVLNCHSTYDATNVKELNLQKNKVKSHLSKEVTIPSSSKLYCTEKQLTNNIPCNVISTKINDNSLKPSPLASDLELPSDKKNVAPIKHHAVTSTETESNFAKDQGVTNTLSLTKDSNHKDKENLSKNLMSSIDTKLSFTNKCNIPNISDKETRFSTNLTNNFCAHIPSQNTNDTLNTEHSNTIEMQTKVSLSNECKSIVSHENRDSTICSENLYQSEKSNNDNILNVKNSTSTIDSSICGEVTKKQEVIESGINSPISIGSPFKGFVTESANVNTCVKLKDIVISDEENIVENKRKLIDSCSSNDEVNEQKLNSKFCNTTVNEKLNLSQIVNTDLSSTIEETKENDQNQDSNKIQKGNENEIEQLEYFNNDIESEKNELIEKNRLLSDSNENVQNLNKNITTYGINLQNKHIVDSNPNYASTSLCSPSIAKKDFITEVMNSNFSNTHDTMTSHVHSVSLKHKNDKTTKMLDQKMNKKNSDNEDISTVRSSTNLPTESQLTIDANTVCNTNTFENDSSIDVTLEIFKNILYENTVSDEKKFEDPQMKNSIDINDTNINSDDYTLNILTSVTHDGSLKIETENVCNSNFQLVNHSEHDPKNNTPFCTYESQKLLAEGSSKRLQVLTKAALKESGNVSTVAENDDASSSVLVESDVMPISSDVALKTIANTSDELNKHHQNAQSISSSLSENFVASSNATLSSSSEDPSTNSDVSAGRTNSSNDIRENPIVELEKIKDKFKKSSRFDSSRNLCRSSFSKMKRHERINNLRRIKDKSQIIYRREKKRGMSESKRKNLSKRDTAQVIKNICTKETIISKMIEIDVEIHKLMTAKMTLYQMLKSGLYPTDNEFPKNDVESRNNDEIISSTSQTSSTSITELSQNEKVSSTVNSQLIAEVKAESTLPTETDNMKENDMQVNEHKTSSKNQNIRCKKNILSYDSENEEVMKYTDNIKPSSSKQKKKQECDKIVRCEAINKTISVNDIQTTLDNKVQSNDIIKPTIQEISPSMQQEVTQHDNFLATEKDSCRKEREELCVTPNKHMETDCAREKLNDDVIQSSTLNNVRSLKDHEAKSTATKNFDKSYNQSNKKCRSNISDILRIPKCKIDRKLIEVQAIADLYCKSQLSDVSDDTSMPTNKEEMQVALSSQLLKQHENEAIKRTIYSDDSTLESIDLNILEENERKKHNTGLALLEETYKREMAESRKLRAEERKKRKRHLNRFLKSMNILTSDEEDLPLDRLYIKKLQQKRDLLNLLDEKKRNFPEQTYSSLKEYQQVWEHVTEVIDAVAEDRIKDLYIKKTKEKISNNINKESIAPTNLSIVESNICESDAIADLNFQVPIKKVKENIISTSKICQSEFRFNDENNLMPTEIKRKNINKCKRCDTRSVALSSDDIKMNTTRKNAADEEDLLSYRGNSCNDNELHHRNAVTTKFICKSMDIDEDHITSLKSQENVDNVDETVPVIKPSTIKNSHDNASKLQNINDDIEQLNSAHSVSSELKDTLQEKTFINNILLLKICNNYSEENEVKFSNNIEYDSKLNETNENSLISKRIITKVSNIDKSLDTLGIEQSTNNKINESSESQKLISDDEDIIKDEIDIAASSTKLDEIPNIISNEDTIDKRIIKPKKNNNSASLRRSSRYTEENTKHVKYNEDNINLKQDMLIEDNLQQNNRNKSSISVSICQEETDTILPNLHQNRCLQKPQNNKKRIINTDSKTHPIKDFLRSDQKLDEHNLSNAESQSSISESRKASRKRKSHTQFEIMNCKVRLIDILKSSTYAKILQRLGISSINNYVPTDVSTTSVIANTSQSREVNETVKEVEVLQNMTSFKKVISQNVQNVNSGTLALEKVQDARNSDLTADVLLCDNEKPEIEIVKEKLLTTKAAFRHLESQVSPSHTVEIIEEESQKMQYTVHKGPILDIKIFGNSFLAASEDGTIYRYSQVSNKILNTYKGHKSAVTCLYICKYVIKNDTKEWMFSGSLDGSLRCYNITSGVLISGPINIGSPVQCMDQAWGVIFIGTKSGHVSRFHIKSGTIKGDNIQFSDKSILALKATNEGPRRVLIVASRSQPITIRDAQNGLFLRTISGQKSHTVYSLMRDNSLIYCGTSSTSIPVFDFTNGEQITQYNAGVGIVCMRLYERLLFAGCYDGNIYVFDTMDHRLICSIPGPGNMLLSMEVINNKIIAGSKDKRLQIWQMPKQVRILLNGLT